MSGTENHHQNNNTTSNTNNTNTNSGVVQKELDKLGHEIEAKLDAVGKKPSPSPQHQNHESEHTIKNPATLNTNNAVDSNSNTGQTKGSNSSLIINRSLFFMCFFIISSFACYYRLFLILMLIPLVLSSIMITDYYEFNQSILFCNSCHFYGNKLFRIQLFY